MRGGIVVNQVANFRKNGVWMGLQFGRGEVYEFSKISKISKITKKNLRFFCKMYEIFSTHPHPMHKITVDTSYQSFHSVFKKKFHFRLLKLCFL